MEINIPKNILSATLSGKLEKNQVEEKVRIDRVLIKNEEVLQLSLYKGKQVFHKNMNEIEAENEIKALLETKFTNLTINTNDYQYSYRITSKGKVLSNRKKVDNNNFVVLSQDRKKKYIIEEGTPVPALVDLGIMQNNGKVNKNGYDKFKQINRFLEIVDDIIKDEKELNIVDFGCGKSYLTFILYYYFVEIKKMNVNITGLDLKEDVIDNCNAIAKKYNYNNLKFYKGDIAKYSETNRVDMIVTLHACDTATDYALYYAIKMNVKYIFSVPCCQHEINLQLDSSKFHLMNKYGIIKERFSALLTDSIRANILEYFGYKTQVLEFVDFDASPKNLLIRAIKVNKDNSQKIKKELDSIINEYGIEQTLYSLLMEEK